MSDAFEPGLEMGSAFDRLRDAALKLKAEHEELREAAQRLLKVIDMAGLHNLSNGVQLGQTIWYVKASDACRWVRQALDPDVSASAEQEAQQ